MSPPRASRIMGVVVLRRITKTYFLGLAWAISLGVSAVATASPRDPTEISIKVAVTPALAHPRASEGAGSRTARWKGAAGNHSAYTATLARRRNRSNAYYRAGEHRVAQISPAISRRADLFLEDEARPRCAVTARRRSACLEKRLRPKGLPDALLEAPTPATERTLKEIGIPAIKDVPPIAILRAGTPFADENFAADLR
jgi:hypothetical protein